MRPGYTGRSSTRTTRFPLLRTPVEPIDAPLPQSRTKLGHDGGHRPASPSALPRPTRVAFPAISGQGWTAGPIYLRGLISSLNQYYPSEVRCLLLSSRETSEARQYAERVGAREF